MKYLILINATLLAAPASAQDLATHDDVLGCLQAMDSENVLEPVPYDDVLIL